MVYYNNKNTITHSDAILFNNLHYLHYYLCVLVFVPNRTLFGPTLLGLITLYFYSIGPMLSKTHVKYQASQSFTNPRYLLQTPSTPR